MRKMTLKAFKVAFTGFILLNIAYFGWLIAVNDCFNRPYPTAKALLSIAEGINLAYVLPLSERLWMYGPEIPVVQPIKWIRNLFYDAGVAQIPVEDAEREIWWGRIKFGEYKLAYYPNFDIFLGGTIPGEGRLYWYWLDEMYQQMMGLAQADRLVDKRYPPVRLALYTNMGVSYFRRQPNLYSAICHGGSSGGRRNPPVGAFLEYYQDPDEIQKVKNILDGYIRLEKRIEVQSPEEYQSFKIGQQEQKHTFVFLASGLLLLSQLFQGSEKLNCNSPYIPMFVDSYAGMTHFPELKEIKSVQYLGWELKKQCGVLQSTAFKPVQAKYTELPLDQLKSGWQRAKLPLPKYFQKRAE